MSQCYTFIGIDLRLISQSTKIDNFMDDHFSTVEYDLAMVGELLSHK